MNTKIVITGLNELSAKFKQFPTKFVKALRQTLNDAMLVLTENVPPYPVKNPESKYRRTGTLGRSLGSSEGGGRTGLTTPDINMIKSGPGPRMISAEWGTRVKYARYVIGEHEQAGVHRGRWWTIKTVAQRAAPKIKKLFEQMTEEMARYINHRTGG